jgi:hypothetical protein
MCRSCVFKQAWEITSTDLNERLGTCKKALLPLQLPP